MINGYMEIGDIFLDSRNNKHYLVYKKTNYGKYRPEYGDDIEYDTYCFEDDYWGTYFNQHIDMNYLELV